MRSLFVFKRATHPWQNFSTEKFCPCRQAGRFPLSRVDLKIQTCFNHSIIRIDNWFRIFPEHRFGSTHPWYFCKNLRQTWYEACCCYSTADKFSQTMKYLCRTLRKAIPCWETLPAKYRLRAMKSDWHKFVTVSYNKTQQKYKYAKKIT